TSALLAALLLAGCALKSAPPRDEIASQSLLNATSPPQWIAAGAAAGPVADNWLATLNDPWLNELVNEAIAYNADLRIAAARVDTAAAYLAAATSPAWPQVNLLARGGGKLSGDASGLSGVGLFATWELDLWGRVRAVTRATEMQYESVQLDTEYARQSLAAMVVKSWILAVETRLQRAQAEAALAASERLASLARDRFRVGSSDEYDVTVAQASVESYRDTVRNLDLSYQNALRALEALLGRYPAASVTVAEQLPRWPDAIPAGLPSELLERRPDVVAAERRVAAAFYKTEEAKAARLPRITLSANFTSIDSELFVLQERNNPLFSFGAHLLQPIFLGGLLQAQVDARTAEQQAAIAEYGKVGIRAFGEVEGALSASSTADQREDILVRAVRENERGLELANIKYRVGSIDLRGVQQQQLALYSSRVSLISVQSERLIQRVNLHLALGGSFEPAQTVRTGDASGAAR
ncbi:MAG TPA: efflux transporter outer membrane subunit, partial [Casimicrobiaceae bacterium]|nr:efflux transporter outer membrane subunit [Casimicrobiaceae bacterium]